MKILIPGHRYVLNHFENPEFGQTIQFIQKERVPAGVGADGVAHPEQLVTISDGTTNEEVLKMLIDRMENLNAKIPNPFTTDAIQHCSMALKRLEERTAERMARGVEGTHKA